MKILALDEDDFEIIEGLQEFLEDVILQLETMTISARNEMGLMIRSYNALSVSRIGFIATDMMNIRDNVSERIQQRAMEINSTTAECILEAESELEYIVSYAGPSFVEVAGQINFELNDIAELLFFPLVDELDEIVSIYENDLLVLLSILNPVTEFDYLIFNFFFDIIIYDIFFEYFLDDLYLEMVYWSIIMEEVSAENFPLLQSSLDYFRFNAVLIQNTLIDCNPDEIEIQ